MADQNQMPTFRPNGPVPPGPVFPPSGQNDRVSMPQGPGFPSPEKLQQPVGGYQPHGMHQGGMNQVRGQGPQVTMYNRPPLRPEMNHQNGFSTPLPPSSVPQGFQQNIRPSGGELQFNNMGQNRMPGPMSQGIPNGPVKMPPTSVGTSPGVRPPQSSGNWNMPSQTFPQNVTSQNENTGVNTFSNVQGIGPPPQPYQSHPRPGILPPTSNIAFQKQSVGPPQMGMSGPPPPRQVGPPAAHIQGMRPPVSGTSAQHSGEPSLRPQGPSSNMMHMSGPPSRPVMPPVISEPPSGQSTGPPSSFNHEAPSVGLPVPFHGQGQYSHQVDNKLIPGLTPSNSEPASQKSSRTNTPDLSQNFDALEGQFSGVQSPVQPSTSGPFYQPTASAQHPTSAGIPPPTSTGIAPQTSTGIRPPTSTGIPPTSYAQPPPPSSQEIEGRSSGITGQRKYPQMPNYMNPTPTSQWQPQSPSAGQFPTPVSQQGAPPGPPGSVPFGQQPGYNQSPQGIARPPGPGSYQTNPQTSFPQQPSGVNPNYPSAMNSLNSSFGAMGLQEGHKIVNLMNEKQLIPPDGVETPKAKLQNDFKKANCSTDIFRCTLSSIPQTSSLLNKSRLPLGILIHPFKDLSQLPVIQSSVIVRCRSCRTYINPFVFFADQRRWKCNLCYRVNELPDEFSFDPVTKTYGDPQRRPEIKSATIEFIAPSEYMLRPPQPAVYLYVIDVSFNAIETGYLNTFCQILLEELDKVPGDSRTLIGFLAFDQALHFFNLAEGLSQPQMLIVSDLDDVFLPCPDDLLVNLQECKELVIDLLNQLPSMFSGNMETGSALGAALQAAFKLMTSTGGRVSVFQTVLPSVGPGALQAREDPSQRSSKNIGNLGPATDFYKKIALDCSAQQIAVDLFMFNGQYADIATISCVSKYSGGCIHYYPSFHSVKNPSLTDKFEADFRRYLTRKIGFESVMRIRCTKGLSIHTFHGNFFVRSTDLLSLPNINPDAGFGMQMSIEESLTDMSTVCFQAALLYTSSKGERRIRVHTMCLPVTNQISEVFAGADQQAMVALLSKMAVDRSVTSSLTDAREAMINAAVDSLSAYGNTIPASQRIGAIPTPFSIRIIPTFILAMLKCTAFRLGMNTRLDDRVFAMQECKSLPVQHLIQSFYANLYPVHNLDDTNALVRGDAKIPQPPRLHLSSANIDRHGVFLMDTGDSLLLYVGSATPEQYLRDVLDVPNFMSIPEDMIDLPELENETSERLRNFVSYLLDCRPGGTTFHVIREDSKHRMVFFQHMVEDRTESSMSYYEFLQHLQRQIKS